MRGNEFLDKMELVDSCFVEEADRMPRRKKTTWVKWGALAACLALVVTGLLWPKQQGTTMTLGGISRVYKEDSIFNTEIAYVWPWEAMTLAEQYTNLTYNNVEYSSRNSKIGQDFFGDTLGTAEATGTDFDTGEEHFKDITLYEIRGIHPDLMVAVDLEDGFYVFHREGYQPPKTWGEVLDGYGLTENLPLEGFTLTDGYTEKGIFALEDDDVIWNVLNMCHDAAFVEDATLDGEALTFTATSEPLGVYKRVFTVSADGYVQTNIFDYQYTFYIGESAAQEIVTYAKEHGTETIPEPYMESLVGTVTEVGDSYLLVDDSIRCVNPKDGLAFQVPTTDLRIRRVLDAENITVGDVVVVDFTGDVDSGNTIAGVFSIAKGVVADGNIIVRE